MRDGDLTGLWDSGPYDYGTMESSQLGLLPDGRGWSVWANAAGGVDVGRFRWRCPEPGVLELRYLWWACGDWRESGGPFTLGSIDSQGPSDEVVRTGFTVGRDDTVMTDEPFTALRLEEDVQSCSTYGLVQHEISIEDDPAHDVAPWGPCGP
ncbi:hypothetical protein ACQPYK_37285 [Streptosporangium sp. CA-135522]|uniref:hypothetical protein n=1 Tax=Streptosporangium sp. CA-135522 TaxID=3240072 RepID=UPI003D94765C